MSQAEKRNFRARSKNARSEESAVLVNVELRAITALGNGYVVFDNKLNVPVVAYPEIRGSKVGDLFFERTYADPESDAIVGVRLDRVI